MTAEELIDHLTQFPPDTEVVYRYKSGWSLMTADDVVMHHASEKLIARHRNMADVFMDLSLYQDDPDYADAEFVDVVCFPGY